MSWYCHWHFAFCIKGILNFTQTSHRPGYPCHWTFSEVWSNTVRISLNSPLRDAHCAGRMGSFGLHLLYVYLPLHMLSWYHQAGTKRVLHCRFPSLSFHFCQDHLHFYLTICSYLWTTTPTVHMKPIECLWQVHHFLDHQRIRSLDRPSITMWLNFDGVYWFFLKMIKR
jgi:hypothetical protein